MVHPNGGGPCALFAQATRNLAPGLLPKTAGHAEKVQRYQCTRCRRWFSDQANKLSYREKKPQVNQPLFRMLATGVSQRACAAYLGIHRKTVARKAVRQGRAARAHLKALAVVRPVSGVVVFDEMETFEHSKMKPLSIALAVDEKSRRILAIQVASMPAKSLLAERSRKKAYRLIKAPAQAPPPLLGCRLWPESRATWTCYACVCRLLIQPRPEAEQAGQGEETTNATVE